MTKALIKNVTREIGNTKARFISILAIIALGVGFLVGIKATSPSMYDLAENYYRDSALMDFRLLSTVGFSEEDIEAVSKTDGVSDVMPSYFLDADLSADSRGSVVRFISLPKAYGDNAELNSLSVAEGRTPEKTGEVLVEADSVVAKSHNIGDVIRLAGHDEEPGENALKSRSFTIVGKARSPLYISYQRGSTTVSDGAIDEFMYVLPEEFTSPRYTELYVRSDFADSVSAFSDEYTEKRNELKERLEKVAKSREKLFRSETVKKAENELKNAEKEFADKKAEAERQLDEALEKLNDGEREYDEKTAPSREKLESAKEQIDSGSEQLDSAKRQAEEQLAAAWAQINEKEAQLNEAEAQYYASKAEVERQLAQEEAALDPNDSAARTAFDIKKQMALAQLETALTQIKQGRAALESAKAQLSTQTAVGKAELDSAQRTLDSAKAQYESGKAEYDEKTSDGRSELDSGWEEYKKAKADAEKQLADAEKKLADGRKQVVELKEKLADSDDPEWYVFTRDDNPGYLTFSQNADRLDAVASVFPLFFLLVAVLVCVTTMTRLIEEKRTEIATLKALGYGNGSIVMKYVLYSTAAAVTGSLLGTAVGVATLPFIIYNAYKIMYYIGDITLVLNVPAILVGIASAVVCTASVSVIVCMKSLRVKPAQAMRPKAPKPGKRVLPERIPVLWNRLGFTAKLTARNLFRYKARLCMTVIGVAGCTALIVAAFGLKNSFDPLTEVQFTEITRYDAAVVPKKGGTARELEYLTKLAGSDPDVKASMLCMQEEAELSFGGKTTSGATSISVFQDTERFGDLVGLRTRIDHTPLTLDDETVMINERLANDFGIKTGDTVSLSCDSGKCRVRVGGIYEQYINHYIFMTPGLYQKLFDREPAYNILCAVLKDKSDSTMDGFRTRMLADKRVVAVTSMAEKVKEFKNMLNALNMVVAVMIICAAALAFVVLYNLTNINIAERVREIATFKVLGFYNRETSSFIYRENIVLTLLGIAAGMGLGVLLTGFIVKTVEIDNVMFGREIYFTSYIFAAGLTLLFSLLVNAVMSVKIRAVNMVESLKSVE